MSYRLAKIELETPIEQSRAADLHLAATTAGLVVPMPFSEEPVAEYLARWSVEALIPFLEAK